MYVLCLGTPPIVCEDTAVCVLEEGFLSKMNLRGFPSLLHVGVSEQV